VTKDLREHPPTPCHVFRTLGPKSAAAALAVLLASLSAKAAAAEEGGPGQSHHFLSPGLLAGVTGHLNAPVLGAIGGELSYTYYPAKPYTLGVGAFAQAQSVGLKHLRAALGAQFNFAVGGVEIGGSFEQGKDGKASTFGVQIAPFVSIGWVSAAFRIGLPVAALVDGTDRYAVDLGLIMTAKIPIPLSGSYF
jgi:hypothetical protein